MAGLSVGGLASGLDTNSIIAQLTALERAKVTREIEKKDKAQGTLDKFKELETRLGNLGSKAKGLDSPNNFNLFKSNSNYEDFATISGGEGAVAGQYELTVYQLATTQKVASDSFAAINTPMADHANWDPSWGGKVTLSLSTTVAKQKSDPGKTTVDVEISQSDSLKDIVNKINAAEGAGVRASLMTMQNGENRLVLTAVDSGTKSFYISEKGGTDFLGDVLGIVNSDELQASTSGSLLISNPNKNSTTLAANGDTTFDKLDNGLGADKRFTQTDSLGIKIGGTWISVNIHDGSDYLSIDEVLNGSRLPSAPPAPGSLNSKLAIYGLEASINDSGEIVIKGSSDPLVNPHFDSSNLENIEIKIGTLNGAGTDFDSVKKDFGKLSIGNVFKDGNEINKAVNAFYTLDGIAIGSKSNRDDKTIVGTTFTLNKAEPALTVKVSLEMDKDGLVGKINEFIEEFNALLKFIDENSKTSVKEETDPVTGKKTSKREVGVFSGDTNISGLRESLRQMVSGVIESISGAIKDTSSGTPPYPPYNGYSTIYSSASRIGIITGKDGYYTVDKSALGKALEADFEGVRKLFTANTFSDNPGFKIGRFTKDSIPGTYEVKNNGTEIWFNGKMLEGVTSTPDGKILTTKDGLSIEIGTGDAKLTYVRGIAAQISNFMEKANSGYYDYNTKRNVDGFFKQSKTTYQRRIDEIQKRVDQLEARVVNYNMRITNQFNALERSMSALQSQTSNMMSALSSTSYRR
jgi:flagellar hook-associated protein 2